MFVLRFNCDSVVFQHALGVTKRKQKVSDALKDRSGTTIKDAITLHCTQMFLAEREENISINSWLAI